MSVEDAQRRASTHVYAETNHVGRYANRVLRPVEVVVLARYSAAFSGRVLEIGCGAGRILGYLVALGGQVHGIDVSEPIVAYCRARYPQADVRVGDMTTLASVAKGPFDAVFAPFNVIDVLPDAARRSVLSEIRELLAPSGLLVFSSHNFAYMEESAPSPRDRRRMLLSKLDRPPSFLIGKALRLPTRVRNRRRLAPLEQRAADHAILNDEAFEYGLLHYYIRRDDQARQLDELGYDLVECLDLEGRSVSAEEPGSGPELHYVARPR